MKAIPDTSYLIAHRSLLIAHRSLLIAVLVSGCHVSNKINQTLLPEFDKEGHRGCRGLMPENTIPAMIRGIELGVTTLEMDAVVTKDKQVILSHEPFFNHEITTLPDGKYLEEKEERKLNIYEMTYLETLKFDVGRKPHPRFPQQQKIGATKPLLSDTIDSVEQYCHEKKFPLPFYNIETKSQPKTDDIFHPQPEAFVDLLMGIINRKGITARVIIQSFDLRTLQILHKKYPQVKTAMLIENRDSSLDQQLQELGFTPDIYSPDFSLVNPVLIQKCHERKMKIIPWTVNERNKIDQLKREGVDGIITDYPVLFH